MVALWWRALTIIRGRRRTYGIPVVMSVIIPRVSIPGTVSTAIVSRVVICSWWRSTIITTPSSTTASTTTVAVIRSVIVSLVRVGIVVRTG